MSIDEFSRDFEVIEDIANRPGEHLLKVRGRASGAYYACRQIDASKLKQEQQEMLEAEIRLFQQLDGKLVTRYLRVLRNDKPSITHLIMEYCDYGTLEDLFIRARERRIPCTEEKTRAIGSQIAHALSAIRSSACGLDGATIMGALTPKSILLLSTGKIRFKGLCSWHSAGQISISTRADYMVAYTAPEVFTSNIYNEQSEVWALGCILYEALTTRRCFFAETGATLRHHIVSCKYSPLPSSISEGMRLLVSEMLKLDYTSRPTLIDVRLSLKLLSDAEKMHHWDPDIITEIDNHSTPVADLIKELIEAANTDIVTSLQNASSPVASSYIYTDLKTSKDSGNVYLAGRVVLTKSACTDSATDCTTTRPGLPTSANIVYTRSNAVISPASCNFVQSSGIRSNSKARTAPVVHTPSMSKVTNTMRHGARSRSGFSSSALHTCNLTHQHMAESSGKSTGSNGILNRNSIFGSNADSSRKGHDSDFNMDVNSSNLTLSNLNTRQDHLQQKSQFLERNGGSSSVRSASVRLPSMSMTTKPENLQLMALHNAVGGSLGIMSKDIALKKTQRPTIDACGTTDLMIAAMKGNVSLVERYVDTQSGMRNYNGMTALMLAAERGQEAVVPLLLATEGRMHVSLPDGRKGKTALMFAAINNHANTTQRLLEAEAGQQDENCNTALMLAVKHQFIDIVKQLVQWEGRITNERGETALMMAAAAGDITSIELLINTEAGLVTTYGWSALCFAVMNHHALAVKALVQQELGLQCFQQGCSGVTALMIAAEAGYVDIAPLLVEKEILLRNKNGEKALDIAIRAGQTDMVAFLENAERLLEADMC
ncbi:Kinase, NEK [Giardia lamblia P15]|uniref:Kinase, NEK n=1 Tax=Giardia intestinalis (strain P15) TaxID=658858 RepID=E1EYP1_GIAIA|nr:Kinase, NEK [Giardia lamblia P15]